MELWQLKYFVSVCEGGSIAKASARLNIAAPAVSRAIKSLEEGLEARLFDRDGRGMHLTEAGKTLLVRATSILRDAELAKQEVSATASRFFGHVTIGMTPSVAAMVGKTLINVVREKYPDVRLRLLESYSGYLIDWVRTGSLGLAIVNGAPTQGSRVTSKLLAVERLFAIGRSGRFTNTPQGTSLRDLQDTSLLLPSSLHSTRELIDDAAGKQAINLTTNVEVDSVNVFKSLVEDGPYIGILPLGAVGQELAAGRLSAAPVIDPEIHSETRAVHAVDSPLSILATAILDEIAAIFDQMKAADPLGVFVEG